MCASCLHKLIHNPTPLGLNELSELGRLLPAISMTAPPALPSRFTKLHGDARYTQYAEQRQFKGAGQIVLTVSLPPLPAVAPKQFPQLRKNADVELAQLLFR